MNQQMSIYERMGLDEYNNMGWVWKAVEDADSLYKILVNNHDELPNLKYDEIRDFIKALLEVKYSLMELIGRSKK